MKESFRLNLLSYSILAPRLKRGWSHLDRQKGGIGLRGAGEKQLELDQRMIGQRIKSINKSLLKSSEAKRSESTLTD